MQIVYIESRGFQCFKHLKILVFFPRTPISLLFFVQSHPKTRSFPELPVRAPWQPGAPVRFARWKWPPGWGPGGTPSVYLRYTDPLNTVDGCEILHELKTMVYPIIYGISTIQGAAGFRWPIHSIFECKGCEEFTTWLTFPSFFLAGCDKGRAWFFLHQEKFGTSVVIGCEKDSGSALDLWKPVRSCWSIQRYQYTEQYLYVWISIRKSLYHYNSSLYMIVCIWLYIYIGIYIYI